MASPPLIVRVLYNHNDNMLFKLGLDLGICLMKVYFSFDIYPYIWIFKEKVYVGSYFGINVVGRDICTLRTTPIQNVGA